MSKTTNSAPFKGDQQHHYGVLRSMPRRRRGPLADYKRLGLLIRNARSQKGLSQGDVIKKLTYSGKQYQLLEQGKIDARGPSPGLLGEVSALLDVPIVEMYRTAALPHFDAGEMWGHLPPEDQEFVLKLVKRLAAQASSIERPAAL